MTTAESTAKHLGLPAHPSNDGNEAYWCGRLACRVKELESLARECREHIGNRYAEDAAMQKRIDFVLNR